MKSSIWKYVAYGLISLILIITIIFALPLKTVSYEVTETYTETEYKQEPYTDKQTIWHSTDKYEFYLQPGRMPSDGSASFSGSVRGFSKDDCMLLIKTFHSANYTCAYLQEQIAEDRIQTTREDKPTRRPVAYCLGGAAYVIRDPLVGVIGVPGIQENFPKETVTITYFSSFPCVLKVVEMIPVLARELGNDSNPGGTERSFSFDTRGVDCFLAYPESSFNWECGHYDQFRMVVKYAAEDGYTAEREITKYREIPVQVEKQRTVTKTKKVPIWERVFGK